MSAVVLGDRARVAVEYELVPDVGPRERKWLFGRLALWVGGLAVGRHDEVGALTVALTSFPAVLANQGKRGRPHLMEAPAEEVFQQMFEAMFVDSGQSDAAVRRARQEYGPLLVLPPGFDLFDGWTAMLIEDETTGRFIVQGPDEQVHEAKIPAGELDRVIDAFLTDLERISGQIRAV